MNEPSPSETQQLAADDASGGSSDTIDWMLGIRAVILGIVTAKLQGNFVGAEFIGAASVPFIFAAFAVGIRKLFRRTPTGYLKWAFGWAVAALLIELLSRRSH